MNRILTIFCALALVVAFTATAQAEVQNVKVSGDINTYGIYRENYDLDDSSTNAGDDAWYQTTTRLKVDADLTDNVAATVRLLNERDWANDDSDSAELNLDLAYITLKEMLYSPMTLKIGRQELSDLTDLVVGDATTNDQVDSDVTTIEAPDMSEKKSFDAIRADFDYAPWTLTLLTAKIDDSDVSTGTNTEDLYGVNAAYNFADYNAMGEIYYFYKNAVDQEISTIGLKGSMDANENLTLGAEAAAQTGDYTMSRDQEAWALDLSADYAIPNNAYTPVLGLAYMYRSGEDKPSGSGDYEAWNTMYENQTHGIVANAILGGNNDGVDSNTHIIKLAGSMNPTEAVTLGIDYYHYILDEELASSGTIGGDSTYSQAASGYTVKADEDDLGDELDLNLTYDYTEDVQLGLSYGVFMPGDLFTSTNDDDASQLLGSVKVSF